MNSILRIKNLGLLIMLLTVLAPAPAAFAQKQVVCGTDQHYQESLKANPAIKNDEQAMEKKIMHATARSSADNGEVLIIPVVFHVIHMNGPEKISRANVLGQIQTLNTCYRKLNRDTLSIRSMFAGLATDARIEFRLATRDPWGNCSTGINYIEAKETENATELAKQLSWWDNTKYLNVWVVKSIAQDGIAGTLAGYAHFPWDAKATPYSDGIMLNYAFCGKGQKTLVHEIGHYLGLYHPFQDSCSQDQSLQGDHVMDTPPVAAANFGSPWGVNSCHQDQPDLPDMIENYMDYADTKFLFTRDQVQRMRSYLLGARASLISLGNMSFTLNTCESGLAEVEDNNLVADVYPNPASTSITLKMDAPLQQELHIQAYDIAGKLLGSYSPGRTAGDEQAYSIPLQQLNMTSNGVYILHISACGSQVVKRLIVAN